MPMLWARAPKSRNRGDPDRYLLPHEVPAVRVRRHVMILMPPLLETLGVIAGALMLAYLFEADWMGTVALVLILIAVVRMLWLAIEWWLERFVVTSHRVILTAGVLTRRVAMMPLAKVTDMTYEKPLIGQLLGYGTFIMESAGQDQALSRIDYLPRADRMYVTVSGLLFGPGGTDPDDLGPDREPPGDVDEESPPPKATADDVDAAAAADPALTPEPAPPGPPPGAVQRTAGSDAGLDDLDDLDDDGTVSPVQETSSSRWARRSRLGM